VNKKSIALVVAVLCLSWGVASLRAAPEEPAKIAGKWVLNWEGRMGPVTATLALEQDGGKIKGTMTGEMGRQWPVTGTVEGKAVKFSSKRETPRGEITIEYTGTVEGDTMKGTMQMGPMTRDWTAKRKEKE
jgi:hypothetical protein